MTPGVQEEAIGKGLTLSGDNNGVVFKKRAPLGFGQVQFQCDGAEGCECAVEIIAPVVAEAPFAEAEVDECIVGPGGADGLIMFG